MDPTERFVQAENVSRFSEAFESEPDHERQITLRRLLLDEESRYGLRREQLELVDQRIAANALRIEKQTMLVGRMEGQGACTEEAQNMLRRLLELKKLYMDHRFAILVALQRAPV